MTDEPEQHRARHRRLLTTDELRLRRVRSDRGRRRRRGTLTGALAVVAVTLMALALTEPGASRTRSPLASRPVLLGNAARSPQHRARRLAARQSRALERVLGYTSYLRLGGHRKREVALTFDDGPSRYTPAILSILRRTHTPATFFVIGRWARSYPQVVAAEARDGFEVGDHTETHPYLSLLSPSAQNLEIAEAAAEVHRAGAPYPRLFRPPYGAFDQATLSILRARRMLMVLWSADTNDYARPGVGRIIYTAVSGAQPGALILMHDGGGDRAQTVAALPHIIGLLRRRGFRLVTVSRLVVDDPPPTGQPSPQPLSGLG